MTSFFRARFTSFHTQAYLLTQVTFFRFFIFFHSKVLSIENETIIRTIFSLSTKWSNFDLHDGHSWWSWSSRWLLFVILTTMATVGDLDLHDGYCWWSWPSRWPELILTFMMATVCYLLLHDGHSWSWPSRWPQLILTFMMATVVLDLLDGHSWSWPSRCRNWWWLPIPINDNRY